MPARIPQYVARSGKNGFSVVDDDGKTYTFRTGSKDDRVETLNLWVLNSLNTAISRDRRAAAREAKPEDGEPA